MKEGATATGSGAERRGAASSALVVAGARPERSWAATRLRSATLLPSANCGQKPRDLLAAPLAPLPRQVAARLVEVQREPAGVQPQQREPARVLLARRDLLVRHVGRERADRALVAVGVAGVVEEHPGHGGVVAEDRRRLRRVERVAGRDRERRVLHDERMVAEHDRRLVPVLGQLGAEPRELVGRQARRRRCRCRACRRCRCRCTRRPCRSRREVRRLVAREELVVEAVVALPLPDAARRPGVADVRPVVVAAGHEVVVAVARRSR